MGFLSVLSLIIGALGTALPLIPGVNKNIATTATGIVQGVVGFLSNLTPGETKVQDVIAGLSAAQALLVTLKQDPSISGDKLTLINNQISEIQTEITAYVTAGQGFNAASYGQISFSAAA